MSTSEPRTMDEWLLTRPPEIRAMAARFPFDAIYSLNGRPHFLLGFSVTSGAGELLILSPINPATNYKAARQARIYVCAEHYDGAGAVPLSLPSHG